MITSHVAVVVVTIIVTTTLAACVEVEIHLLCTTSPWIESYHMTWL